MIASDFDLELEDLWKRSAGRLMAAEVFDSAAFSDLLSYLGEKAEIIKSEHVVSKQVLHCILWTVKAIDGARSLPARRCCCGTTCTCSWTSSRLAKYPQIGSQGSLASYDNGDCFQPLNRISE